MNTARLMLSAACLSLFSGATHAEPLCAKMLDEASLEKRYQRLAPIYNSADTGWIFGSDQFDNTYTLNETQQRLFAEIVERLAAQGTQLAVLIAPPRPVLAGQEIVDATIGKPGVYDISAIALDFQKLIAQLQAAGAAAPDLQTLALSDDEINADFYFARDTHWTNIGAAHSALALSSEINPEDAPAFAVGDLKSTETFDERGSLADIARATCETVLEDEQVPVFVYADFLPAGGGLLGDAEVEAVLVGTSFSDRYKRDQYQTADALSAALGMNVTNLSVSGGGMIGPFETYALTGGLTDDKPKLLIWEFPYTYQMKEPQLRQLLGALRANNLQTQSRTHALIDRKAKVTLAAFNDLIGITPEGAMPRKISAKLRQPDGSVTKLSLRRKSRMAEVATLPTWWIDLSGLKIEGAVLEIEFEKKDNVTGVNISTLLGTQ